MLYLRDWQLIHEEHVLSFRSLVIDTKTISDCKYQIQFILDDYCIMRSFCCWEQKKSADIDISGALTVLTSNFKEYLEIAVCSIESVNETYFHEFLQTLWILIVPK